MKKLILLLFAGMLTAMACSTSPAEQAAQQIDIDSMLRHIETLSSDEFEGRATGTPGEQRTVDYLVRQLESIGATPAASDGSFIQPFPLLGQQTTGATMQVDGSENTFTPAYYDDFMAWPSNQSETVSIEDAELVYVGYGIQAPEENWDDFKGMDLSGKILVFKNSDPSYDPEVFKGETRLYYGRYTYKYEVAREQGALGALIIHTPETAGYGWNVVANGWSRERFYLKSDGNAASNSTQFNGWMTYESSSQLFAEAGLNMDEMLEAADSPDFEPVSLDGVQLDLSLQAEYREIESQNIVASIEGSDPELKDEYLQLTAHIDHLGITRAVDQDSINNGASDNAAGVSALLEMMKAYKSIQPELKRSVLAVLVSAEEVGLLGSQYWAENPTVDPGKVTGNINLDGMNVYGLTEDVVVVGYGRTTLSDILEDTAREEGRTVKPDSNPDQGYFYRSDHFNMAKIGIPAIFPNPGDQFVDKPEGYAELVDSVSSANYHTVQDEINEYWDLRGAVADTRLFFKTGFKAINAPELQSWDPGDEFEATRLRMLENNR